MAGLEERYIVEKWDLTEPVDENAKYFVLRLDKGGEREHVIACRKAIMVYADNIRHYLPELADDIWNIWGSYRTLMTIKKINDEDMEVVMAQYGPNVPVTIPLDIIPENIRKVLETKMMLIAEVNIQTKDANDLFFYDFEIVEPDVLKRAEVILEPDKNESLRFCEICLGMTIHTNGICQEHDHNREHWVI